MLQITVDLSTADKGTLVKTAQFILQFAGYEPPAAAQGVVPPQEVTHPLLQPVVAQQTVPSPTASPAEERAYIESKQPDAPERFGIVDPQEAFSGNAASTAPAVDGTNAPAVSAPATNPAEGGLFPPPPPPPAGIDVDARGLPWDGRIHAGTRAKTVDGNWRQKRGTDAQEVAKVEAQLRQTMAIAAPAIVPPVPVPPPPFAGNAAPPAPPASSTPPVPASAGAATTASPGSGNPAPTFPQLMGAITQRFISGVLTKLQVDAALTKVGLPSLPLLASRADLVPAVATELGIAL